MAETDMAPPAGHARPILILDHHPLFREALCRMLESGFDAAPILTAESLTEARSRIEARPDLGLVILDPDLPDSRGLDSLQCIQDCLGPGGRVAVFSGVLDSSLILQCLRLGARGYLPKTMTGDAVRRALALILADEIYVPPLIVAQYGSASPPGLVQAGGVNQPVPSHPPAVDPRSLGFTDRQASVLRLVLRGLPNKLICREMNLAEGTIKVHVSAVLRLLGVRNRTHAIIAARELGLIGGEPSPFAVIGPFNRSHPATRPTYVGPPRA